MSTFRYLTSARCQSSLIQSINISPPPSTTTLTISPFVKILVSDVNLLRLLCFQMTEKGQLVNGMLLPDSFDVKQCKHDILKQVALNLYMVVSGWFSGYSSDQGHH